MMEALHADGVKLVLTESLGRLARDLMVQESILHDLKRNGFDWCPSPTGSLQR